MYYRKEGAFQGLLRACFSAELFGKAVQAADGIGRRRGFLGVPLLRLGAQLALQVILVLKASCSLPARRRLGGGAPAAQRDPLAGSSGQRRLKAGGGRTPGLPAVTKPVSDPSGAGTGSGQENQAVGLEGRMDTLPAALSPPNVAAGPGGRQAQPPAPGSARTLWTRRGSAEEAGAGRPLAPRASAPPALLFPEETRGTSVAGQPSNHPPLAGGRAASPALCACPGAASKPWLPGPAPGRAGLPRARPAAAPVRFDRHLSRPTCPQVLRSPANRGAARPAEAGGTFSQLPPLGRTSRQVLKEWKIPASSPERGPLAGCVDVVCHDG